MEVYIPKIQTPDPSNIKDFRAIALLNVEGKMLFRLLSKRLEKHIIYNNKFINTSVQILLLLHSSSYHRVRTFLWQELSWMTSI